MVPQFIDFLLVEKQDESLVLITIESHSAEVGSIVEFNGGTLGRVVKKAWAGKPDGELVDLIKAKIPTFEAEAIYWQSWKKESDNGETPGNP